MFSQIRKIRLVGLDIHRTPTRSNSDVTCKSRGSNKGCPRSKELSLQTSETTAARNVSKSPEK